MKQLNSNRPTIVPITGRTRVDRQWLTTTPQRVPLPLYKNHNDRWETKSI